MDPTQNKDSFDSFGPGGNNTGGPVGRRATSVAVPVGGEQGASVTNNGAIFSNPMAPAGLDQMSMNSASSVGGFNQTNFGAISGNNTGDIVIGNDSKKTKKGLVIGLMTVVFIIVGGVLMWLFMPKTKDSGNLVNNYNLFANYMVSGEQKTTPIDIKYDFTTDYYYNKQLLSADSENFYNQMMGYWDSFANLYEKNGIESINGYEVELIQNIFDDEKQLLVFVKQLNGKTVPNLNDIISAYKDSGESEAMNLLIERFSYLNENLDNSYIEQFKEYYEEWVKKQVERLVVYDAANCFTSELPDSSCIETKDDETKNKILLLNEELRELSVDMFDSLEVSDSIMENVFVLNDIFNGTDTIDKMSVRSEDGV